METANRIDSNQEMVLLLKNQIESFNQFYFNGTQKIEAFCLCSSCGEACDCDCPCSCDSICDCDCSCPSCSW